MRISRRKSQGLICIAAVAAICSSIFSANCHGQAIGVPMVASGTNETAAISARIENLPNKELFLGVTEAKKQLERVHCDVELAPAQLNGELQGREVWDTARSSYVRLGWYCLCNHCNERHVNLGGGFFVTKDGVAATAAHVVAVDNLREGLLIAVTDEGVIMPVSEILAVDKKADVCLVQVGTNDKTTPLGLNTNTFPGDEVWCYSNPMQHGAYFSRGIINRFVQFGKNEGMTSGIHVSSNWAPGSSGAAILDRFGNAVGIVSGIETLSNPVNKQPLMSINRAARVADLIRLCDPQNRSHR